MSNNKKKLDGQLSLFEMIQRENENKRQTPKEGSLNFTIEYKKVLSKCVSRSKYSVYEIAARMTEYLNTGSPDDPRITHDMIYTWTAPSKSAYEPRPSFLPALCYALGDDFEPIEFLAQKTDRFLMRGPDALRSYIQKKDEEIEKSQQERDRALILLEEINPK